MKSFQTTEWSVDGKELQKKLVRPKDVVGTQIHLEEPNGASKRKAYNMYKSDVLYE